jgi:Uma2 family endonuclease
MQHGITVRVQRKPKNEIARFEALKPQNLAISKPSLIQKTTLNQPLSRCSRATNYDPEPDVTVVDAEDDDERYSDHFYLAAEIVSSSDRSRVESKREVYKLHDSCACILTVQQDCFEVRIDLRTDTGWSEQVLKQADDLLALSTFGLRCKLADLYRGTPLVPRRHRLP